MKLIDQVKEIKEQNSDKTKEEVVEIIVEQLKIPAILASVLYELV